MPNIFPEKFLTPAAGILCAVATVIWAPKAATAFDVPAISIAPKSSGLENLFLVQASPPSPGRTSPTPSPGRVIPVPLPVKIPEPSTVVGLGLVASSLVLTRRRRQRMD
ncbi:MAG: PEP-CTERM sorting domain-containing protein [Oscillatoriales cyanobacterium RU_3_3]|nr:PEP-CTERM sorting domain-containing protein [Microcoleus sp. SU_5_6]NJL67571.1 PEP-CTERM sorting domain-containing protein [Microcoleus sp. SM1_3_4]NJM60365.1 PEP-CTERM sorting domain-containing protein [Oscillatoriales cyanobacterium RU_3_3]NJR21863.1 PEP-CTERM sorting domain-containing protein [Richelia sp. CSU_2_1]